MSHKVGDTVECAEAGGFASLTNGKIYVVQKAKGDGTIDVINDAGSTSNYFEWRFIQRRGKKELL